jgi:hypothetical protein
MAIEEVIAEDGYIRENRMRIPYGRNGIELWTPSIGDGLSDKTCTTYQGVPTFMPYEEQGDKEGNYCEERYLECGFVDHAVVAGPKVYM